MTDMKYTVLTLPTPPHDALTASILTHLRCSDLVDHDTGQWAHQIPNTKDYRPAGGLPDFTVYAGIEHGKTLPTRAFITSGNNPDAPEWARDTALTTQGVDYYSTPDPADWPIPVPGMARHTLFWLPEDEWEHPHTPDRPLDLEQMLDFPVGTVLFDGCFRQVEETDFRLLVKIGEDWRSNPRTVRGENLLPVWAGTSGFDASVTPPGIPAMTVNAWLVFYAIRSWCLHHPPSESFPVLDAFRGTDGRFPPELAALLDQIEATVECADSRLGDEPVTAALADFLMYSIASEGDLRPAFDSAFTWKRLDMVGDARDTAGAALPDSPVAQSLPNLVTLPNLFSPTPPGM
jgi:hypothetical protein